MVLSPESSRKLYLKGQRTIPSDTVCYPAKLLHGHVEALVEQGVDNIWYPCMSYNNDEGIGDNHYNCPVVAYYPELLAANVRCRLGEIDLIAARGGFLVFVEVKQRKSDAYGSAAAFVDARKQQRIRLTAEYWLLRHPDERQPRFDVIEVYLPYGINTRFPRINHIENAFE